MFKIAKGSADRALSYFANGDEKNGYWRGSASSSLGLEGSVTRPDLEAVLSGEEPKTGEYLLGKRRADRTSCFDALFAAPKTLTILAAIQQEPVALAAHRAAVDFAIDHLELFTETERCVNRVRSQESTGNLAVACFEHCDSRIDRHWTTYDPHLHTHLVLPNLTRRLDGKWRAYRDRPFFVNQVAIGLHYQVFLASRLHEAGYSLRFHPSGYFDIECDSELISIFSRRSQSIYKEYHKKLAEGRVITLDELQRMTRKPKSAVAPVDDILSYWQQKSETYSPIVPQLPSIEQGKLLHNLMASAQSHSLTREIWRSSLAQYQATTIVSPIPSTWSRSQLEL